MRWKWTTRTSLFARMSLLFGLLVTVPLVISGIVLSLAGWRSVYKSRDEVVGIGKQAVTRTAARFKEDAESRLEAAAEGVARIGAERLEQTSDAAVDAGKEAFREHARDMTDRGRQAVQGATTRMGKIGRDTLGTSLTGLRNLNQSSLQQLSQNFEQRMQAELDRSSSDARKNLEASVLSAWELSADRRAFSISDYVSRVVSEVVLRLQLPLKMPQVQYGYDDAPQLLEKYVRKSPASRPEILRVVVVSGSGAEMVRVPQTEAEHENWDRTETWKAFFAQPYPYIVEPVRRDELTTRWVVRLVHQMVQPEAGSDSSAGEAPAQEGGGSAVARQPTGFVVVDLALENLTDLATTALPQGMQVMVIHAGRGARISSHPRQANPPVPQILEQLPKGEQARQYQQKAFDLQYRSPEGEAMLARALYWGDLGDCWTVVAQPESLVRRPVIELEADVRKAWMAALAEVRNDGKAFVEQRSRHAERISSQLTQKAAGQMRTQERELNRRVAANLNAYEKGLVTQLEKRLGAEVKELQKKSGEGMTAEARKQAREAVRRVEQTADLEASQAGHEMESRADQVAKRTAGQILLNSAWLVPLFLVLALFLATLTARSLVRPINQLVKGTQLLAAGEYHQRIRVRGEDELARLALAFNEMADAIERGQAELQQSHDVLAAEKARIQAIVCASPDGLLMLEPEGQVAFINPAAIRNLGLKAEEIPPAPFEVSQLPAPAAQRLRECLEAAEQGETVREYEITEPHRTVLQLREVRLRSESGRSFGRLIHLHDITRERVIDEMKSDFISLVSHELRTPLTSILGFSSYLRTGKLGEVGEMQKAALESIHRQAKRLSAIISDFLDISRIESGKVELKKEPIPVATIAGRVVEDLRPQASEKSIQVTTRVEEGPLPLVALGDEQRIAQIFTNLVGNALKFTDREGRVDVLLARQNGEVVCRVRDTGCGIPAEELARVFDRFYQVEKVVTRKTGGTGLGLAIVKNIVEAHGGRVWIESRVGEGTAVSFTLPGADDRPAS